MNCTKPMWQIYFQMIYMPSKSMLNYVNISIYNTWIILYMHPANEGWHYIVTSPLIGWVYTQNDPCNKMYHWLFHSKTIMSNNITPIDALVLQHHLFDSLRDRQQLQPCWPNRQDWNSLTYIYLSACVFREVIATKLQIGALWGINWIFHGQTMSGIIISL